MDQKNIIAGLVILTVLSIGFAAYANMTYKNSVSVPVSAKAALDSVKNEPSAKAFIAENFGDPEDRIERVALTWNQATDTYVWEIEIQERSCGCRLNESEGVTILKASVDPYNGAIYNLSTRVGVPEDQIKREACEKGCHSG